MLKFRIDGDKTFGFNSPKSQFTRLQLPQILRVFILRIFALRRRHERVVLLRLQSPFNVQILDDCRIAKRLRLPEDLVEGLRLVARVNGNPKREKCKKNICLMTCALCCGMSTEYFNRIFKMHHVFAFIIKNFMDVFGLFYYFSLILQLQQLKKLSPTDERLTYRIAEVGGTK